MKLSDAKCRTARPTDRMYKLADGHGLYLHVMTSGARYWRLDYRFGGKRKTLALGVYPEVSLAEARAGRDKARKLLKEGTNPAQQRKIERIHRAHANANTFGLVADELLAKLAREKKSDATLSKRRWLLKDLASPLANRPIASIEPVEILAVLRDVESRGHLETARRLRSSIGQVMRLAVATGRAANDPTPALRGAIATPKVTHRAAIIDWKGAGRLMLAVQSYDRVVVRSAMEIMAYCFPRPGECRLARWDEIDFEEQIWTIPAERAKMRREHKIPLSRQALETFTYLRRWVGGDSQLCFPGQRAWDRPISENTIAVALRTMGFGKEEMSAHGFGRSPRPCCTSGRASRRKRSSARWGTRTRMRSGARMRAARTGRSA